MFRGVSASHGGRSAFCIEITAIQSESRAFDSAIVLLLLRDKGRKQGGCYHGNDTIRTAFELRDEMRRLRQ
jgi:hypothetical protein